jgi:hypothetical protein
MLAWKVAPALAAGCTIVLKPSELTPLTALEFAALSVEAGLPAGVLNVVTGLGGSAGAALAAHKGVDKMAFTGSVPTGTAVALAGARDVKPVTLELGGKSPIVVFDDADIEAAVEWVPPALFLSLSRSLPLSCACAHVWLWWARASDHVRLLLDQRPNLQCHLSPARAGLPPHSSPPSRRPLK